MAQPIAPEVWQEGIDDNRLLPGRHTTDLFTGSGVNIANNSGDGPNSACRVWDIQISDYITDYDDRRINGYGTNTQGSDGWGASAYGIFQDVRFDSRIYTMGRHRSMAMRVFDEQQYSGTVGQWGTESTSNVITPGQALMKTAATISKAKKLWEEEILGPDIDRYNLFAVMNGHISGRCVGKTISGINYNDRVFDGDASHYEWVAQPGMVQGQPIPPRFAPIHAIEWDDDNIPLLLQNIKVTWNNLFIPQDNRVFILDPMYEYRLLSALTGTGVPVTEAAYADLQNGSFTRLMGWDFRFDIPTEYYPKLYLDDNLNVIHSANGTSACDKIINSITGGTGDLKLQRQLAASDRMGRINFIRTGWDPVSHTFTKTVTNYPLGQPVAAPYFGDAVTLSYDNYGQPTTYPFTAPGSGYGLNPHDPAHTGDPAYATGPVLATGTAALRQVIGCALYKPAAQLSQEYSSMQTAEGGIRGKFSEIATDVKYDAWVIERFSHGILPIIDAVENTGNPVIRVGISTSATNPLNVKATSDTTIKNTTSDPVQTHAN